MKKLKIAKDEQVLAQWNHDEYSKYALRYDDGSKEWTTLDLMRVTR